MSRQRWSPKARTCKSIKQKHESSTSARDALFKKIAWMQTETEALKAQSATCANRHETVRELMRQVINEQHQLAAAEKTYQCTEDAVREWACLAEHWGSSIPATGTAPVPTVQAAIQAAAPHAAFSMLAETIAAEATRLVVHILALRIRRLEMSWSMSHTDPQVVQQLLKALQKPGMLPAKVEEQAFNVVMQQLSSIRKCNKQLTAQIVQHAATRIYKDKRGAHIYKAMQSTTYCSKQFQQQCDQMERPTEVQQQSQQHSSASQAARAAAAALGGKTPDHQEELEAQELELRYTLKAFDDIRDINAEELELHSRGGTEEFAMVMAFLEKMSAQLHDSHKMLYDLEGELKVEHDTYCKLMLEHACGDDGVDR